MSTSPFQFAIDVDNDLDFTDANEDISAYVMAASNVTCSRGKDAAKSFASPAAGTYNAELLNVDRRFSPGNVSSPYYGIKLTGKRVQWLSTGIEGGGGSMLLAGGGDLLIEGGGSMLIESASTKQIIWTGRLLRFLHHAEKERRTAEMPSLSMLSRLVGKNISTAVYQNIKTSDAISIILDATGWPASERIISMGQTTLAWWWWDGDAFQGIVALLLSEGPGASVYDNPLGHFVFEDREYRNTQARCLTPQATYTDLDARVQPPFDYDENEQNTIEACSVTVEDIEPQALAQIWSLGSDLTLGPDEVWKQRFKGQGAFINALVPDPTLSNTIWELRGSAVITSGSYKIEYLGQRTAAISGSASGGAVATALQALTTIGSGNASGSGSSLNSGIFIELIGAFAGINITDLPTIVESTLNPVPVPADINVTEIQAGGDGFIERQRLEATGLLISGMCSFSITFDGATHTTGQVNYNATATEIRDAFREIFQLETTTAFNGPINQAAVDLNFVGITLENIDNVIVNQDPTDMLMMHIPSATVNVSQSQQGGVADYVLTSGSITWTLERTSGTSALLTGVAGATGAAMPGLRVRGQLISTVRTHEEVYPADVEDRILNGEDIKKTPAQVLPGVSRATAALIAQLYVEFYLLPRPTINLTIVNSIYSGAKDAELLKEISDRITVEIEHLGINGDFFVEQITQSLVGTKLITTLGCEMVMVA